MGYSQYWIAAAERRANPALSVPLCDDGMVFVQVSLCGTTACSTPSERCRTTDSLSVDPTSGVRSTRSVTSSPGNAHIADLIPCGPPAERYEVSMSLD